MSAKYATIVDVFRKLTGVNDLLRPGTANTQQLYDLYFFGIDFIFPSVTIKQLSKLFYTEHYYRVQSRTFR